MENMFMHHGHMAILWHLLFLVEYISWLDVMEKSSQLWAGRVQDLLAKATIQVQKERLKGKSMVFAQELISCWSPHSVAPRGRYFCI